MGSARCGQQLAGPQSDKAIKTKQRGRGAGNRFIGPLPLGLDAKMGTGFGEGDFDLPAADKQGDDVGGIERCVCAEESLRFTPAFRVPDKHPADRLGRCARSIPQRGIRGDFEFFLVLAPIPGGHSDPSPRRGLV